MVRKVYLFLKQLYKRNRVLFQRLPFDPVVRFFRHLRERTTVKKQRYRNRKRLSGMFLTVLETPAVRCNQDAHVEIHTTTAHHHYCMYITAIKSLLRYCDDLAVVVHDDGTLTRSDKRNISEQVKGIRIIDKKSADREMNKHLAPYPLSRKFRRGIVNAMELFDNILLAKKDKIISMNSDVLFLKRPNEVIEWLYSDSATILSVYEENPARQAEFIHLFKSSFPAHVTLCLVCFYKNVFDTPYVESILSSTHHDWYTAQNIYPLLFDKMSSNYKTVFLNKDTYQSSGFFDGNAKFKHYWTSTGMFTSLQFAESSKLIGELAPNR